MTLTIETCTRRTPCIKRTLQHSRGCPLNTGFTVVILSLTCIFICCAFTGDSYQKSKPGNEKRKSEVSSSYRVTKHRRKPSHSRTKRKSLIIIRIREALWRKLNNLKPLFRVNEEHCISKEVKGNALASKGKSCRPKTTITAVNVCHDLSVWNKRQNSHLLSQNVFLQRYNLPDRDKIHWNKQHFGMRWKSCVTYRLRFCPWMIFFSVSFHSCIYLRSKI